MIKFKNILKENPDYLYTDKMSLAFNSPGNWCFGIDSQDFPLINL